MQWRPLRAHLASGNAHKLDELQAALPGWEIELLERGAFPDEDGETYYENARGKARFGREVGEPDSVDSRRGLRDRGGGARRPARNRVRAVGRGRRRAASAELDGATDRRARYVCELVALAPDGRELRGTGILEGTIASERRGDEGFGYDPIFVPTGEDATVAELGKRLEAHELPPRPRRSRPPRSIATMSLTGHRRGVRDESDPGHGRSGQAGHGSSSRRACHQLISAPKMITFAIT